MTPDKITVGVIAIVKAHAEAANQRDPLPDVSIGSTLHDDLGLDHLDITEILMDAEEVFDLHLEDDGALLTVEDIVTLIKDQLREKAASGHLFDPSTLK